MKTIRKKIDYRLFPWVVLGLLLLTFGLLTSWLGFYFDDWPAIANLHLRPISTFWDFEWTDRPVLAWTYIVSGPLLGERPIVWQFFSIFVRWLTVLGVWWSIRALWPGRKREAAWIALLFAVFPAFDQQAISVTYSQHWMIYALFAFSIGAMLQAEREVRRFYLWTSLAISTMAVHIFSMEYFAGLELLRPIFLLIVFSETNAAWGRRIKSTLKRWLPYLAILAVFVLWRIYIFPQNRGEPNNPELLFGLLSQPLSTLLTLAQYAVQDFLNIVVGSWYKTLDPAVYILNDRLILASLAITMIAGASIYFFLRNLSPETGTSQEEPGDFIWYRQALPIGFLGILLGVLPVWLTGRQTTLGLYGSRFELASMFGASIFTIGLLEWITPRRLTRIILISLLVALAVGFHIRRVETFHRSWVKQSRFYWQLYWRIPDLKPGASIAADGEMFLYVGRYSTALTLNIIYPEDLPYPQIGHYFYELPARIGSNVKEMVAGQPINWKFRNFIFDGSTHDTVLVYYEPEQGNCLWVVDPSDKDNPDLSALAVDGAEISNLDVIQRQPDPKNGPPSDIFGPEPEHTWCYFFEKADLARQFGDWQEVADLGDQAQESGFSPNNPQEWIPFIEGYARVGRWQEAMDETLHVHRVNFRVDARLCRLWGRVTNDVQIPAKYQNDYQAMMNRIEC
jgi:hypothetical protein